MPVGNVLPARAVNGDSLGPALHISVQISEIIAMLSRCRSETDSHFHNILGAWEWEVLESRNQSTRVPIERPRQTCI
jgi:hypothetical protein